MGAADEQKKPSRKLEITSLVLSVVAIITAGLTYLDQRSVNGITQARYERRYADRIAWWPDNSGANEEIRVQNRSTMPISNVVVGHVSSALVDPGSTESWLLKVSGVIPPCSLAIIEVPEDLVTTELTRIAFRDGEGRGWVREGNGLLLRATVISAQDRQSSHDAGSRTPTIARESAPLEDCTDS